MTYFGPTLFGANQYCRPSVCKVIQNAVNPPKYRNNKRKTGKTHFTLASPQHRTWIYLNEFLQAVHRHECVAIRNYTPPPFYCYISPNSVRRTSHSPENSRKLPNIS